MRNVCNLDVHKDSVFIYIFKGNSEKIIKKVRYISSKA